MHINVGVVNCQELVSKVLLQRYYTSLHRVINEKLYYNYIPYC